MHFLCVYLTGVELEHVQMNFYKPHILSFKKLTVDLGLVDQKALQRFHLATNVYFSMTFCQIQQISRVLYPLLLQVTSIVCPQIILQISTVLEPSRNPSSLMSSSLFSRWKRTKWCVSVWLKITKSIHPAYLDWLGFNKHCYMQGGYGNMERLSR